MKANEREQFISKEDEELKGIRENKIRKLKKEQEKAEEMSKEPVHLTDSTFEETIKKNSLVLVDFWAGWCGPCIALAPTIVELSEEYTGKILIGKLNVDENPKTAECFQVFSIPTLVVLKDGCEVDRIVGLCPKKHIESALKKHLR